MSDTATLQQLIIRQSEALRVAGELLGRIAASRSSCADEAMAAFSWVVDAQAALKDVIERDMGTLQ